MSAYKVTLFKLLMVATIFSYAPLIADDSGDTRVKDALAKTVNVEFDEVPLTQAAASLAKECGVAIVVNDNALANAGIGSDCPVSLRAQNISVRSALLLISRAADVTFVARGDFIEITTRPMNGPEPDWSALDFGQQSGRKITELKLVLRQPPSEDGTHPNPSAALKIDDPRQLRAIERFLSTATRPAYHPGIVGLGGEVLEATHVGTIYARTEEGVVVIGITHYGFMLDHNDYDTESEFYSWGLARYIDVKLEKEFGVGLPRKILDILSGDSNVDENRKEFFRLTEVAEQVDERPPKKAPE